MIMTQASRAEATALRHREVELARFGMGAGALTLAGVILSGPVALAVLAAAGGQPGWIDAATYVASYRSIQRLPYALGIFLVTGCVMMVLVLARLETSSLRAELARILATVFATMILLNYVIQTTFVPAQVDQDRLDASAVAAFTMTNPSSLAWSLEMWGYGFLGIALWLVASALNRTALERATARLIAANGVISVVGGLATSARQDWVFTRLGMVSFAAWNLLVAAIALCFALMWRARLHDDARESLIAVFPR